MAIFLTFLLFIIWILKNILYLLIRVFKFKRQISRNQRQMSRRPPLHTIGAAILAVVHDACARAKYVNGPIGLFAKTTSYLLRSGLPFIYSVQYQWLSVLFFADDCILAVEAVVEKAFPPSRVVFDAVDKVVCKVETLPGMFDDVLDSWSEILLYWKVPGSQYFRAKEKDIMMDGCTDNPKTTPGRQNSDQFPRLTPCQEMKTGCKDRSIATLGKTDEEEEGSVKCSYKEILEKEKTDEEEEGSVKSASYKEILAKGANEEEDEVGNKDIQNESDTGVISPSSNDPIFQLYDSSWHTK